jgi:hypothetical protein
MNLINGGLKKYRFVVFPGRKAMYYYRIERPESWFERKCSSNG